MSRALARRTGVGGCTWATTARPVGPTPRTWRGTLVAETAEHYEEEGGLMDERAIAYSDMATVITLDGKAEPKWELNRG